MLLGDVEIFDDIEFVGIVDCDGSAVHQVSSRHQDAVEIERMARRYITAEAEETVAGLLEKAR
jgi:hypothetical protein